MVLLQGTLEEALQTITQLNARIAELESQPKSSPSKGSPTKGQRTPSSSLIKHDAEFDTLGLTGKIDFLAKELLPSATSQSMNGHHTTTPTRTSQSPNKGALAAFLVPTPDSNSNSKSDYDRICELESEIDRRDGRILDLESEIETKDGHLLELEGAKSDLEAEMNQRDSDIQQLETRNSELEDLVEKLEELVGELERRASELALELEDKCRMVVELESRSNEAQDIGQEHALELENRISELENEIHLRSSDTQIVSELQEQVILLEQELQKKSESALEDGSPRLQYHKFCSLVFLVV